MAVPKARGHRHNTALRSALLTTSAAFPSLAFTVAAAPQGRRSCGALLPSRYEALGGGPCGLSVVVGCAVFNLCPDFTVFPYNRALRTRVLLSGALVSSYGHVITSLIDVHAEVRQLVDARKMFEEMSARLAAAWNCMLAACVRCGEVRDVVAGMTMIGGSAIGGRLAESVELFWELRKAQVKDDHGICRAG